MRILISLFMQTLLTPHTHSELPDEGCPAVVKVGRHGCKCGKAIGVCAADSSNVSPACADDTRTQLALVILIEDTRHVETGLLRHRRHGGRNTQQVV